MSSTSKEQQKPSFEVHYRRTQAGEYEFVRSIYMPTSGPAIRSAAGEFDDDVGVKAAQICLLNLKLQIEGHGQEDSSENFRVLAGDEARPFGETVKGMFKGNSDGPGWWRSMFGNGVRFFQNQGTSNPVIVIKKENAQRPKALSVQLAQGLGTDETNVPCAHPQKIREIIESLERQIQFQRTKKTTGAKNKGGTARESSDGEVGIAQQRAERAWGALEDYICDLANPDTPNNKLYGIDRLNDAVWKSAETYTYFSLQAREYMRANYTTATRKWNIVFSEQVLNAIKQAVAIAKTYLPNHDGEGHSLTAFDDWQPPQSVKPGKPKFEIVRILIWSKQRLKDPEAFAVVRTHKIFNIPLFYLEPSMVQDGSQDEYILFCKESDTPKTPKRELRGLAWDASLRDWGQARDLGYHPLAHFQQLLKHPKLLFAIDARAMMLKGTWDSFEEAAP